MKKTIFAFFAALSTFALAYEPEVSEDGYVYVEIPISCKIGSTPFQFGDMTLTFSKIEIPYPSGYTTVTILEAMEEFATYYATFLLAQKNAGLKEAVANANMPLWCAATQAILENGRAKQIAYDESLAKDAEGASEEAAAAIAEINSDAASKLSDIDDTYPNAAKSVQGKLAMSAIAVAAAIKSVEKDLNDKIEEVKSGSESAKPEACQCATEIAELQNKFLEFDKVKAQVENLTVQGNKFASIAATTTNNFASISHWLGSTTNNDGVFICPVSPRTGNKYDAGNDINDYLSDVGVVAYVDAEDMSATNAPSFKYRKIFYDSVCIEGDVSITNTMAIDGFGAVYNWADGESVICTNGAYTIHPQYQFVTNIIWTTNWTEATEHITTEETKKIINVVTNVVRHDYFVTNYLDTVTSITNYLKKTEDFVNFTTNVFFNENFITNVFKYEYFITNYLEAVTCVTNYKQNVDNYINFVTNTFFHENFITNTYNHEYYITNYLQALSVVTNYHNVTTYDNIINFQTNFISQSVGFTNWFTVYHMTTNTMVITSNIVFGLKRILALPEPVDPTDPNYDPKEDPYSPEYEPEPGTESKWKRSLFYKYHSFTNTLFNITNNFNEVANLTNLYDNKSVWINGLMWSNDPALTNGQVEIKGYANAGYYYLGTNETVRYIPKKVAKYRFDEGLPVMYTNYLEWAEEDETSNTNNAALDILTNDIEVVKKFIQKYGDNITINTLVTNAERFTEMRTNFFAQVDPEALLDNASVWTNGEKKIEAKGYEAAPANTFYVKDEFSGGEGGRWELLYTADSDAFVMSPLMYNAHRSIDLVKLSDYESLLDYPFGYPTNNVLSVYGYLGAAKGTTPVKIEQETQAGGYVYDALSWQQYYIPDLASLGTNATYGTSSGAKLELYGFADAQAGKVPKKTADGYLEWGDAGGNVATKYKGNDGSEVIVGSGSITNNFVFASSNLTINVAYDANTNLTARIDRTEKRLTFKSGSDSNIKFVTIENDKEITIEMNVYYK